MSAQSQSSLENAKVFFSLPGERIQNVTFQQLTPASQYREQLEGMLVRPGSMITEFRDGLSVFNAHMLAAGAILHETTTVVAPYLSAAEKVSLNSAIACYTEMYFWRAKTMQSELFTRKYPPDREMDDTLLADARKGLTEVAKIPVRTKNGDILRGFETWITTLTSLVLVRQTRRRDPVMAAFTVEWEQLARWGQSSFEYGGSRFLHAFVRKECPESITGNNPEYFQARQEMEDRFSRTDQADQEVLDWWRKWNAEILQRWEAEFIG